MKTNGIFRKILLSLLCGGMIAAAQAQDYPVDTYDEPDDGSVADKSAWNALENRLYATWASKDVHYPKREVPALNLKTDTAVYVWRGERVGVEALLFSPAATEKLSLRLSAWAKNGQRIEPDGCEARFLNYVLTDEYKTCGTHPDNLTPYLVPDVIDREGTKNVEACTVRPVWCTLEVPRDMEAGTWSVDLEILDHITQATLQTLHLDIHVQDRTLPLPEEQEFNLNLWQQPYAASRYYQVEKWSNEHLEVLRPYMERLARAGQRVVTTILFYEPWGDQSHDKFDPMVETTRKADGTWAYDYTIFDRYVEFMASCGIDRQINCFSMVPWDMSFRYFDESTGQYAALQTTTSSSAYQELWTSFLTSFAAHLREKGWFDKTCIAMDERALADMQRAYNIAQAAVPGIKMALAGNYHTELADKLYDYCVALNQFFTPDELAARQAKGWVTTAYTSCADAQPNIFSNSDPVEAAYLPLYCAANGFNGYLHWSWMNWAEDPLRDSRFRLFAPGDTYCIYPGNRSSVRFERLIEGIQAYEKIRILRAEYTAAGNTEALATLNAAVAACSGTHFTFPLTAAYLVNRLEALLNGAPEPPMEEATEYCEVTLAASNKAIAVAKRWLVSATTTGCETDLAYTASAPSADGYVLAPQGIRVLPGTEFSLRVVPTTNDDDIRYCRAALFADWNRDFLFDSTTAELIARVGQANTANTALLNYTFRVSVPANAKPGKSLLRLCYNDAWLELPEACGELYKGFAFDIPMEIIPLGTAIRPTDAPTIAWQNGVLTADRPVRCSLYNLAGVLLDRTDFVTTYAPAGHTPGAYIVRITDRNGEMAHLKFIQR